MLNDFMPYNVAKESVELQLKLRCALNGALDLQPYLSCALLKPLTKKLSQQNTPHELERMTRDHWNPAYPDWLWQAIEQDKGIYVFTPDQHTVEQLNHICDWLKAAVENDAAWLQDTDDKGRPKKLVKIGSLEQAVNIANKDMEIERQRLVTEFSAAALADNDHEQTVMSFEDGFRIRRLLTTQALDLETIHLGHCVGNGGYDRRVESGEYAYYSLRDPANKGHATLEVLLGLNQLRQCKGKQNRPPATKYMPYIQAFVKENQYKMRELASHTGLIAQDGEYYDIFNLPENFNCVANLDFQAATTPPNLPDNLTVAGFLLVPHNAGPAELPKGLHVKGGFATYCNKRLTSVPADLKAEGGINLQGCTNLASLPPVLQTNGDLILEECRSLVHITDITLHAGKALFFKSCDNLETLSGHISSDERMDFSYCLRLKSISGTLKSEGNLNMEGCFSLENLPEIFRVGGSALLRGCRSLKTLPVNTRVIETLDLRECTQLEFLPENMHVGALYLGNNLKLKELPEGLKVDGTLDLMGVPQITSLPDDLIVGGDIAFPDGVICNSVDQARRHLSRAAQRVPTWQTPGL